MQSMATNYKDEFVQYMVDVKGYTKEEAEESFYNADEYVPNVLSAKEIKEMFNYSK